MNSIEPFLQTLSFRPDDFQIEAMDTIAQGRSVVVCAPTGSGKTLIAEYAVHQALKHNVKVFYTTPLKALSNQKFYDFKQLYGENNVALLTGDLSVNRGAAITVMTTEIFRNMLYGITEDKALLDNVGYVVLDECHYMNDAQRGTVWEESIIYCPKHIQLIALSATIANDEELTEWINRVHHDTSLIHSDFRPVPLRFSYFDREKLLPLFEQDGKMNKQLKTDVKGNRFDKKHRQFNPNVLIEEMNKRDMLPAIFFTFSRKGCDLGQKNARELNLLEPAEKKKIRERIHEYVTQFPFLKGNPALRGIENGIAAHHAGLLPALKMLVESLFQDGLIKVVFATETLAAGINMPARATVITALSKRTDDGHRLLNASEFMQMSGRAGRRGKDTVGYVVVVSSPYEGAREAATLASSKADPLNSQFTPTYGMVLNLLQRYSLKEAEFLVSQSFGQFTWNRRMLPLQQAIEEEEEKILRYQSALAQAGLEEKQFFALIKTKDMVNESHRQIRTLEKQLKRYGKAPDLYKVLAAEKAKRENLQRTLSSAPVNIDAFLKTHKRLDIRYNQTKKHLKTLRGQFEGEKDIYWKRFISIYTLLKTEGYLDENDKPTEHGLMTANIRTENEFAVAELIRHGLLDRLSPGSLAAVCCAISNDSNRDHLYSNLRHSHNTQSALREIGDRYRKIYRTQRGYGVDVPVNVEPMAAGLIEAWADGAPWSKLINATNLSEGDVVRIARRSADLLRQLSRIEGVPPEIQLAAKLALPNVLRDPVKELDVIEVTENLEVDGTKMSEEESVLIDPVL